jgi:hypothetical protein
MDKATSGTGGVGGIVGGLFSGSAAATGDP